MRKILISLLIGCCVLFSLMACETLESITNTFIGSSSKLEDGNYATSAPGFGNAFFEIHDNKFRVIGVEVQAEGVIRVKGDDIEFETVKTYNGAATGIIGKGKILGSNEFTLNGIKFFFWTPYNPDGTL
jgi:hypothetical protein